MLNVAFYDRFRRDLVQHEQVAWDRDCAPYAALSMCADWESGNHRLPSPYWVIWNDPEDMSVFQLDGDPLDDGFLDDIHACVARFVFLNSGPTGSFKGH